MKILFITGEIPYPSNSGARIYTWERIKQLSKYNQIDLICLREKCEIVEEKILGKNCEKIMIFERIKNYKYILVNSLIPYSMTSRYNEKIYEYIKKNSQEYDLIILDTIHMILNIPKDIKVKMVLTQHNIEWKAFQSISNMSKNIVKKHIFNIESKKLKKYEQKIYKSNLFEAQTFISDKEKDILKNDFNINKSLVVPNGCNLDRISLKEKKSILDNKNEKSIVFTGKMNYEPNIQGVKWFIDEIFEKIKLEFEDIKLYIVGKDPAEEILNCKNKNIIVTGKVDSVKDYLENANLVIIPLLSGGGVKIKLLEAVATQNLIVTTSIGSEGTEFKNKKHIFIENEAQKFAQKCIDVLKEEDEYIEMIENCNLLIDEFYMWDKIGLKYNEFLSKL